MPSTRDRLDAGSAMNPAQAHQLTRLLARFAALVLLLACCGLASASTPTAPTVVPRIGVLTMGPGEVFWERFGHDAIVVDDPTQAEPTSYNFGYFDM